MNEPKKRKFNIIDILVLLILLAAVVFFAIKVLKPDATGDITNSVTERNFATAHFTVEVDGMRKEMYDAIASQLPAQMMASGKLTDGNILSVRCEECKVAYLEASNPINAASTGFVVPNDDAEYVNAFFVCDAPVDLVNENHYSVSQEIRMGRLYYVKTPMFEVAGTIIELTVDEEAAE